jgi:phospholipid/cholesterol/gamma-HCH transport system substrate-binding protein
MKRALALVAVGVVSLTACDLTVTSMPLPGGADLGNNPYSVKVIFRDVLDLVPQSSVKVDDVTVGKVTKVELKGYDAQVTVEVRGDVDLPDNALAEIRQTSLLGEKFVSLSPPATSPEGKLSNGDVIPLDRTGRNPEVEEVLGALSLVLNGGGVAQLKTISVEVNKALSGRESSVKSVLRRISDFMGQVDANKGAIVEALRHVNDLSVSLNQQQGTLDLALGNLPKAIASIDRQRDDLVKVLKALAQLSDVGTRVIQQSKAATIDSLNALAPTLTKLAAAGDDFPRSLQIALTYPFVDAIVGQNAQQARDWHMGDYSNLSVQLDVDLRSGLPSVPGLPGGLSLPELLETCAKTPLASVCTALGNLVSPPKSGGGGGGSTPNPLCAVPLPILCPTAGRVAPGAAAASSSTAKVPSGARGADAQLGAMLVWGMVQR